METLCLDVPLLDPTGDFSGPRAPSSFLPVKDVWITYYWFLRQTSRRGLIPAVVRTLIMWGTQKFTAYGEVGLNVGGGM